MKGDQFMEENVKVYVSLQFTDVLGEPFTTKCDK